MRSRVGAVIINGSKKTKRRSEDCHNKTTSRTVTLDERNEAEMPPTSEKRASGPTLDREEPRGDDTLRPTCKEGAITQTADVSVNVWARVEQVDGRQDVDHNTDTNGSGNGGSCKNVVSLLRTQ